MVQPSDFGKRHDRAHLGPLDGSPVGRILLEREVSSCVVVVREVACQDAPWVPFAQNENMIQALAPDRADALRKGILPRTLPDLLGRPVRGGVVGHVEVDDAAAIVSKHDEDEAQRAGLPPSGGGRARASRRADAEWR
jgi:hypothetical protein